MPVSCDMLAFGRLGVVALPCYWQLGFTYVMSVDVLASGCWGCRKQIHYDWHQSSTGCFKGSLRFTNIPNTPLSVDSLRSSKAPRPLPPPPGVLPGRAVPTRPGPPWPPRLAFFTMFSMFYYVLLCLGCFRMIMVSTNQTQRLFGGCTC